MLTSKNTGLVVIDIQGNLAQQVFQSEALLHNTLTLIKGAKLLALPIIHVEQAPLKLGNTVKSLADELTHYPLISSIHLTPAKKRHLPEPYKKATEKTGWYAG